MADTEPANEAAEPTDNNNDTYIHVQADEMNAVASASEAEDNNDEAPTNTTEPAQQPQQEEQVEMAAAGKESQEKEDNNFAPPISSGVRKKSIREEQEQRLRVVVQDIWNDQQSNTNDKGSSGNLAGRTNTNDSNRLRADQHNSSLISRVTSILIDEVDDETQAFETSVISLPKSPICALLLMESVGVWTSLDRVNQASIVASIVITILAQVAAGATVFTFQLYSDVTSSYNPSDAFLNLVVISFIVIYLSQDCAQIYKMYVLLRWMRRADRLKRHAAFLIVLYLVTNGLLYVFLLYYSIVELLIREVVGDKLQAAIAVYFILELDDWLYNVTIEPLKILEEQMFNLNIRGRVGSKAKRLRHVTYWFWSVFLVILILQILLFFTRTQENLTIGSDEDATPSP